VSAYRIRVDPWSTEYESALQILPEEDAGAAVELGIEGPEWRALRPVPAEAPGRLFFVDGVRRIEHRLLIEAGGQTVFGLLGSFGVGGTEVGERAHVGETRIGRLAIVGSGLRIDPFVATNGSGPIRFEPVSVPDSTPVAPLQELQTAMRRSEAALASELAAGGGLVFLDGPLSFLEFTQQPVVGCVKRLLRSYLPVEAGALLPGLGVGERTPLFLIRDASGRGSRYSCYTRLGSGRTIDAALAGIVRLEVLAGLGLAAARAAVDSATALLPRFASDAAHDPRAPQNLYPIGGLEARLRHLLGDPLIIRRAIESQLHQEAVA